MDAVDDKRTKTSPVGDAPDNRDEPELPAQDDAAFASPATADPRTTISGRYAVDLQTLPGDAGIAVTYQGRDLRSRDPVVVKTLRLEYRGDPEMRARFRREARLLQFLTHPNVIRALTFAEERGAPWLILERVPGRSLREEIDAGEPFSPERVVPLLRGMAAALDHLHARGLVHLDVRPDNVVVTPSGDVKLIDFGTAQTAGTMQEQGTVNASGSVNYLAPEQVSGEPVSAATDVFALGCIVYELLTGKPPFPSKRPSGDDTTSRNAAIRARLEQAPASLAVARGDTALPGWIDDVVLGALERDPRLRYSSAGSFAAVFHSGVEGDVDVETGRPRLPIQPDRARQFPLNEPGIAVKGSSRLSQRRGGAGAEKLNDQRDEVVDAAFASAPTEHPVSFRTSHGGRIRGLRLETLARRLWQAVIIAAALNLLLIGVLVVTRGEIPGIWNAATEIGPGVSVRIAGTGLVARGEPRIDAPIVADLPDGGTVSISGDAVTGADGIWWPVEIETASGVVVGYVPDSWVQAP